MRPHPYLTNTRLQGLQYIVVPKTLLESAPHLGLDMDEAVMYCVLRSRCDLSLRNGWVDELGRVFITFTRPQMASYLGWGKNKAIAGFRALSDAGLIVEQDRETRGGGVAPKRIYVRMWSPPRDEHAAVPVGLSAADIRSGALPFLRKENIRDMTGGYFVIPRLLLEHPAYAHLPLRAKLLYVITMDQLNLSLEFGQTETLPTGETVPYCYLDRQQLLQLLQCSDRTLTSVYQALESAGLMERKKVSYQSEMRIYLRDFLPESDDSEVTYSSEDDRDPLFSDSNAAKTEPLSRKNETPIPQVQNPPAAKTEPAEPQFPNPSKRDPVRSFRNPFAVTLAQAGEALEDEKKIFSLVSAHLEADALREDLSLLSPAEERDTAEEILDLALELLTEDVCFPGKKLRLGTDWYEKEEILAEYARLDRDILLTMVLKIARQPQVRQLRQYVHRCLFTAADKHEGESYYTRLRVEKARTPAASSHAADPRTEELRKYSAPAAKKQ